MAPAALGTPSEVHEEWARLSACEKESLLWSRVSSSRYSDLAAYPLLPVSLRHLGSMVWQGLEAKGSHASDFAPAGWIKQIHARGVVAPVEYVSLLKPQSSSSLGYTGVFASGARCGLLRLSLTSSPDEGEAEVAPGLSLKIFRDGSAPSADAAAIVSLEGQGNNFNFFAKPMSNIVPLGKELKYRLTHHSFRTVTTHPEELLVSHLAEQNVDGSLVMTPHSPRQIFFVPNPELSVLFSVGPRRDVREDLISLGLPKVWLYQVWAVPEKYRNTDYREWYNGDRARQLRAESQLIGEVRMKSGFIASDFGDRELFFRHQMRQIKSPDSTTQP